MQNVHQAAGSVKGKRSSTGYQCRVSLWETAGTRQLEGKKRSRGSAKSKAPLIRMARLRLQDPALTLSHSQMEMHSRHSI